MIRRNKSLFLLILVLVIIVLFFSLTTPYFFKLYNLKNILDQSVVNIILGIGMTYVICAGGIDLSIGSIAAFSSAVFAMSIKSGIPLYASILLAFLVGGSIGLLNGYLISVLKINHFISTLASMSIWRGLTLILTKASPIYGFPHSFTTIGTNSIGYIPITVIICSIIMIISNLLFRKTRFGHYSMALGSNEEALRRTGVKVNFYKIKIYIFSALMATITGLLLTAKLNCADPLIGNGMEMDAIAVVILGGTSISGGKGSIIGTVVAGLLLTVLKNGLVLNGIPSYYQQLVTGIIIIFAVISSEKMFSERMVQK